MKANREQRILLTRYRLATEALSEVLQRSGPADRKIESFFRQHRKMGSRDRAFVAEAVYGCIRHQRSLQYRLGKKPQPDELVLAFLVWQHDWPHDIFHGIDSPPAVGRMIERLGAAAWEQASAAIKADLPDWLYQRLALQLGDAEAHTLAEALNQTAPLDIRVNTLKTGRKELQQLLGDAGFPFANCPYSHSGLRRSSRAPLFQTQAFREGLFEVQDEGSQLIAELVEANPGERVVDLCAGAGGKTLHLGVHMNNAGTLYAFDVAPKRLDNLKERLRRAGLHNVRTQAIENENDMAVKRLRGTIDRVLVDAPCTGTGTLRRNPDIKWRDTDIDSVTAMQMKLLTAAAPLLKPGGRLVYATCSLLQEENENIVSDFLAAHPGFRRLPVADILQRKQVALECGDYLRLWPHRHNTDGFFAAVLERQPREEQLSS